MKSYIPVLIASAVCFVLAAGAALGWRYLNGSSGSPASHESQASSKSAPAEPRVAQSPPDEAAPGVPSSLQVPQTDDLAARLVMTLRDRVNEIKQREEKLRIREDTLKDIQADIQAEQAEIVQSQKRIDKLLREHLTRMQLEEKEAAAKGLAKPPGGEEAKDSAEASPEVPAPSAPPEVPAPSTVPSPPAPSAGQEARKTKHMAAIYDALEPQTASKIFQLLAQDGSSETVVDLFLAMKERQAASVLDELTKSAPELAAELTARKNLLKAPPSSDAAKP